MACSIRDVAQKIGVWVLCLFYSAQIVLMIVVLFFKKPHSKFWVVKKRPYAPQALVKHEYGVSKFVTVNVSGSLVA